MDVAYWGAKVSLSFRPSTMATDKIALKRRNPLVLDLLAGPYQPPLQLTVPLADEVYAYNCGCQLAHGFAPAVESHEVRLGYYSNLSAEGVNDLCYFLQLQEY